MLNSMSQPAKLGRPPSLTALLCMVSASMTDNDAAEKTLENSLTLEGEPVLPRPYLHQLTRLEREPYRVRQNSQGEPELYAPGRLAMDLPLKWMINNYTISTPSSYHTNTYFALLRFYTLMTCSVIQF